MTPDLPPFVLVNASGEYRSQHGWTTYRDQAVSFPDAVSAADWAKQTPRMACTVANKPIDINAERYHTLRPVETGPPKSDYEPVS